MWQEHVECVSEEVLAARGKLVKADAKIDVVGDAEGVWLLFGACPWIVGSIYPLTSQFLSPSFRFEYEGRGSH